MPADVLDSSNIITLENGTVTDADDLNSNFDTIADAVNTHTTEIAVLGNAGYEDITVNELLNVTMMGAYG